MRQIDRRTFLVTSGLAVAGLAAACSRKGGGLPTGGTFTIDDVLAKLSKDPKFQVIQAVGEVLAGPDARVAFALVASDGNTRLTGGSIDVYAGINDGSSPGAGPVRATWHDQGLGDKGVYIARLAMDKTANWTVVAVGRPVGSSKRLYGQAAYPVVDTVVGPATGAKAISVPTPTVSDHRGVEPYCTRTPPCSMHQISLDVALANGKPTVFNIGTPRFCTSRVCGPVVDVIQTVSAEFTGLNFIHAEVYANDKDAPAKQQLSSTAAAYSLEEEPITYWIRADGTITERIVGPTDIAEVRETTRALATR